MWAFLIYLFFLAFVHSIGGDTLVNIVLILSLLVWAISITDFRTKEEKEFDDEIYELDHPLFRNRPFRVNPQVWVIIIIVLIIIAIIGIFIAIVGN